MNTGELMPTEDKSKPFNFFFAIRISTASLRHEILMTTIFNSALDFTQQHKPQYFQAVKSSDESSELPPPRSLPVPDSETPDISKHSRLEYCSFSQH